MAGTREASEARDELPDFLSAASENELSDSNICIRCKTPAKKRHARELWRRRWLVVEQQFGGAPYFLASGFSLVDIYIAVVSRWAQQEDWRPANLPSVEAVAAAVGQRPACAPIWACHELGQ